VLTNFDIFAALARTMLGLGIRRHRNSSGAIVSRFPGTHDNPSIAGLEVFLRRPASAVRGLNWRSIMAVVQAENYDLAAKAWRT